MNKEAYKVILINMYNIIHSYTRRVLGISLSVWYFERKKFFYNKKDHTKKKLYEAENKNVAPKICARHSKLYYNGIKYDLIVVQT